MDDDLNISRYNKIDTTKLDKEPLWDFVGLEDSRIFRWEGDLYISGAVSYTHLTLPTILLV